MQCPKCKTEIARFDLSANCKKCGAHILYYTQEEDLKRDAQKTELEFATARVFVARVKAAFVQGKLPVIRLVAAVFCVLSLVVPVYNIAIELPWWNYKISVGAIGVYLMINDSFYKHITAFSSLGAGEGLFYVSLASFIALLLIVVAFVVIALLFLLSFINVEKTSRIIAAASWVTAFFGLTQTALSVAADAISSDIGFVSVTPFYGGLVVFAAFTAFGLVNFMLSKNAPVVALRASDSERMRIKKALKSGEIQLSELSLPIVEDEEKPEEKKHGRKRGKKK